MAGLISSAVQARTHAWMAALVGAQRVAGGGAAEVAGGARGDQCVDTPSITGVGTSSERAALAGVICCACGGTVSIAELIGVEYAIAAEL